MKLILLRYGCISGLLLPVVCLLISCTNYRTVGLLQVSNPHLPVYETAGYEEYRLRVNDEIAIRLISTDVLFTSLISGRQESGSDHSASTYRVFDDGTLDLPFIKSIEAEGLTLEELARKVETLYREMVPDVVVKLALVNNNFTVIGEAGSGVFPMYNDRMTVYQALSVSGRLFPTADYSKVRVIRESGHGTEILEFDMRPSSVINSKYYYVYPNDVIYVQKANSAFWKIDSIGALTGLISSSLTLLLTVIYLTNR